MRPRLLDAFCGLGGCSVGYARAGFDVVGIDIEAQPHYPFFDVIQGDAIAYLTDPEFLDGFDAIHASPPCKLYTAMRARSNKDPEHLRTKYDTDLLDRTRAALIASGKPYVIENVVGAPLLDPVMLCGSMFGLGLLDGTAILKRHRLFESNVELAGAGPDSCLGRKIVGVYGAGGAWTRTAPGGGGVKVSGPQAAEVLGIEWSSHQPGLSQAIPPAYTEHIGRQLIAHLGAEADVLLADFVEAEQ